MSVTNTLGRRKSAVARVYMQKGKGKITINKRDYKDYCFLVEILSMIETKHNICSLK